MNQLMSGTEFLAMLKREAKIQDTSEDTALLEHTNEALAVLCSGAPDLKEFQVRLTSVLSAPGSSVMTGTYIGKIHQIFYQRVTAGNVTRQWAIGSIKDVVSPSPVDGYPAAYDVRQTEGSPTTNPQFTFNFYPLNTGAANDQLLILASGIKAVSLFDSSILHWAALYPFVKAYVLRKVMLKRNQQISESLELMYKGAMEALGMNTDKNSSIK